MDGSSLDEANNQPVTIAHKCCFKALYVPLRVTFCKDCSEFAVHVWGTTHEEHLRQNLVRLLGDFLHCLQRHQRRRRDQVVRFGVSGLVDGGVCDQQAAAAQSQRLCLALRTEHAHGVDRLTSEGTLARIDDRSTDSEAQFLIPSATGRLAWEKSGQFGSASHFHGCSGISISSMLNRPNSPEVLATGQRFRTVPWT